MKAKSESEVAQSCPTLSDPMECSLQGSSIHGIFQARVLEWGAIAFSILYTNNEKTGREIKETVPFFFLKIALAIRGFLYFHTNCEIICSSSVKKYC